MRTPPAAIIMSVFDSAIREINALEVHIVTAEDDADAMLWRQAEHVVEQLNAGLSQRKLAEQWINVRDRDKKSYSHVHVHRTAVVFERYFKVTPRPRFRDAYNAITNAKPPTPKPNPEPFQWINAVGDLVETVEKLIEAWPEDARPLAPKALRDLAESLEQELGGRRDVNRRDRTEGASTDTNPTVQTGAARAS